MMQKPRSGYGRSRTLRRDERRAHAAVDHEAARIAAARRVAATFVAARWPELAGVTPSVSARHTTAPSAELLSRLGLDRAELAQGGGHYTFVFSGARGTADGCDAPLVATVTVDDHQRIVKTSVTR